MISYTTTTITTNMYISQKLFISALIPSHQIFLRCPICLIPYLLLHFTWKLCNMAPPSGWFSTCPVSQFRCVSECIWKYGYFQQVVACLLTLLWLVCVYMAFSGYTLGKVMRVLYAKGPCNAKNHGCQRSKRQPQIMWPFRTATVRFSIITSSKTVAANDCDNNRQLAVAIWPHKPEVLLSRELR